jgi:hypothetical protein
MHPTTFVTLLVAGLVPFAVTQTIDPSTVDETIKGKKGLGWRKAQH